MNEQDSQDVRWGILGCGDVTEIKSGPALQKAARSSVVVAMRRDKAKAADYAARHGIARSTDDADQLISDPEVSAIYIATPPNSHADYAIRALRAGKNVLVEKPMAPTIAECEAMNAVASETGRKLCVAFYRRALPRFERLREIVQDGTIGEPRMVEVRHFLPAETRPAQPWKLDPEVGGGGFFTDVQAHTLDWLTYVFGTPGAVRGLCKNQAGVYSAEDLVTYILDFGGLPAVGLCSYAAARSEERVIIHGSRSSASMNFFSASPITLEIGETRQEIDLPDPPHVHQPLIERVVAHFLDGAPNPCDGAAGRQEAVLVERIFSGI
ncbi:Gfo/Idh/MocA family protein [Consotaella aegiceratis]|uniref:Gfo/Idh/MocA family protein n=1 Tax=Consotaella aegiceratis TaxID=3097961 RepID=UPI002F3E593A